MVNELGQTCAALLGRDPETIMQLTANGSTAAPRNLLGSRKRKAYLPRNSGMDEVAPCAQAPSLPASNRVAKRRNTKDHITILHGTSGPAPAPRSPQAASSKAQSSGADHGSTEHATTSDMVAAATESLAATRSRRNIKPREKFDPRTFDLSGDFEEAGDSRSCGSSDTLAQRTTSRRLPDAGVPRPHGLCLGLVSVPDQAVYYHCGMYASVCSGRT